MTQNQNTTSPLPLKETMTGARAVIESLLFQQVETLFGYPGGAIMPIYDAIYDYKGRINHILSRHEQGAIHSAQAYARKSGKVGVVFATSGPGATNLITGLADAMADSTPLVCFTGQVASSLLGTDAFQEADVIGCTLTVSKWSYQITSAEEIPDILDKAFKIAQSGRPGPVVIDITKDAQFDTLLFDSSKLHRYQTSEVKENNQKEKYQKLIQMIEQAQRPLLLFGQGVVLSQAEEELEEFVTKSGIPTAWTIMGKPALPYNNPYNIGMLGMHGNYAPNIMTSECDLMIGIGMRFDDRVTSKVSTFCAKAKKVHIDIDETEMCKILNTDLNIVADAKSALKSINQLLKKGQYPKWMERAKELLEKEQEVVINNDLHPESKELTMSEVIRRLNEKTNREVCYVTDVGQHQMMACRYAESKFSRSLITSGGLGTMGFGLPAAIGAQVAAPSETIIALLGDGGFQMTVQELGTIMQYQLPVKIVVLNNNFLGMVRQWQEMFFDKRYSFTEMFNPDFVGIAKAFGISGEQVETRENLVPAIEKMLKHPGAYILNVSIGQQNNVFPMIPSGANVSDIRLK